MVPKVVVPVIALLVAMALLDSGLNWQHQDQFEEWALESGKAFSPEEYAYRLGVFKKTVQEVLDHNARYQRGEESYEAAINAFSDLTHEEFTAMYLSKKSLQRTSFSCSGIQPPSKDVPQEFDWSAKSAVTSVRSQVGSCVSGYAIAAAESVESGRYITVGDLKKLSVQQIIDCSSGQGNKGCQGGNIINSFQYLKRGGIASEDSYPFLGKDQPCAYNLGKKEWEILGCVTVTPKSEAAIKAAVYHQPIAASINGSKLKNYSKGIFESTLLSSCKTDPDTWMLMVGYGTDGKKNYWKLKNSWGVSWGQNGYLFIVRKGDGEGECGVQNELYYPHD